MAMSSMDHHSNSPHQNLKFWGDQLSGELELLQLPTDRRRPASQNRKLTCERRQLQLPTKVTIGLRALSKQEDVVLFVTLLSGWAALLARWSEQDDVIIGTLKAVRRSSSSKAEVSSLANVLPLRVLFHDDQTVKDLLGQVKGVMADAYRHEVLPFHDILEELGLSPDSGNSPLFQVLMQFDESNGSNAHTATDRCADSSRLPALPLAHTLQPDLYLSLVEGEQHISGELLYDPELFDGETIGRLITHWQTLLAGMIEDAGTPISQLSILTARERALVMHEFNRSVLEVPDGRLMHQLLEEQAHIRPDVIAVRDDGEQLTFSQLNRRSNRLAHYLSAVGVKPEVRVGICLERSLDMIVCLLSILKAGGTYVPVDPSYPADRLQHIVTDSDPIALLTQSWLADTLPQTGARVIALDEEADEIARQPAGNPDPQSVGIAPDHLAYMIYTSGSTGTPKAVMVSHRNVLSFLAATDKWLNLSQNGVWTQFHSYAFDFSVLEIWASLLYGNTLVLVPHEITRSASSFYRLLCQEGVTVLCQTPSAFRQVIGAQDKSHLAHQLQSVLIGGEPLEVASLKPWYERNASDLTHLFNIYGPTETTVFITLHNIDRADIECGRVGSPIGSPIQGSRVYILDKHCQPVPIGVTGEIYIGGTGVARGYRNRSELTKERFLPDPFGGETGARMYRTGDLGRWRVDGSIEYMGRNDFQVKIRGFRIELGDIESHLLACPGVREAIVVARENPSGDRRLVAYLTLEGLPESSTPAVQLRAHLLSRIPEYMVPSAYVVLERMPLTPSGKLDRKALPAPDESSIAQRQYEPPRGEIELSLTRIWQELLRVPQVGRDDNFFEIGGDSLLGMNLIERVAENFAIQMPTAAIFQAPTVQLMAMLVIDIGNENGSGASLSAQGATSMAPQRLGSGERLS